MSIDETDAIDVLPASEPPLPPVVAPEEPEKPSAEVLPFKSRKPATSAATPFAEPETPKGSDDADAPSDDDKVS
jgi:hypothetical protein